MILPHVFPPTEGPLPIHTHFTGSMSWHVHAGEGSDLLGGALPLLCQKGAQLEAAELGRVQGIAPEGIFKVGAKVRETSQRDTLRQVCCHLRFHAGV